MHVCSNLYKGNVYSYKCVHMCIILLCMCGLSNSYELKVTGYLPLIPEAESLWPGGLSMVKFL